MLSILCHPPSATLFFSVLVFWVASFPKTVGPQNPKFCPDGVQIFGVLYMFRVTDIAPTQRIKHSTIFTTMIAGCFGAHPRNTKLISCGKC